VIDHLRSIVCSFWQRQDPRVYQSAVLAGLSGNGVVWQLPPCDPRRALISRLCLSLLPHIAIVSHAMLLADLA
jgi:hypothetical protein